MPNDLELSVANPEQRRAAHANVHDVWSKGLPLEAHLARRMASPLHNRATWYVGSLDGRVVAGLGCHPVIFRIDGQPVTGIAIAAVHTLPEFRGHGFAPRVIAFAEATEAAHGARLSVLFSDIRPAYYERIGYQLAPAHSGWATSRSRSSERAATGLERFAGVEQVDAMAALFHAARATDPLWIERTPEYGRHLIERYPDDEFYWLVRNGERLGFARVYASNDALLIRDWAVTENQVDLKRELFLSLLAQASERGLARVGGWLPADSITREFFEIGDRTKEITMFKPLGDGPRLSAAQLSAADELCEIDHV